MEVLGNGQTRMSEVAKPEARRAAEQSWMGRDGWTGGLLGTACAPPRQLGSLGSAVSFPIVVRGEAQVEIYLDTFSAL